MRASKQNARNFLPWGGLFLDPDMEPEMFASLPGWRQREVRCMKEARMEGRDPSKTELLVARDGYSTQVPYSIPDLPLSTLKRDRVSDSTSEPVTLDKAIEHCTSFGEGTHLVETKPHHPIYAFVWLMVMIKRGRIDHIPITYLWELPVCDWNILHNIAKELHRKIA